MVGSLYWSCNRRAHCSLYNRGLRQYRWTTSLQVILAIDDYHVFTIHYRVLQLMDLTDTHLPQVCVLNISLVYT